MTSYFERISSYMERMEKRLAGLEKTAQDILKNQKNRVTPMIYVTSQNNQSNLW